MRAGGLLQGAGPLPDRLPDVLSPTEILAYDDLQCLSVTAALCLLGCLETGSLQVGNHSNEEIQEITVISTLPTAQNKFHVD